MATRDGTGAAREPWEVDDHDHWPGTSFMSIATRRGSREEQILVEFKLPNQIDSPSSRLSEDFNDLEEGERDEGETVHGGLLVFGALCRAQKRNRKGCA